MNDSDDREYKKVDDAWGTLVMVKNARGGWKPFKRIVTKEDGTRHEFKVESAKTPDYFEALRSQNWAVRLDDMSGKLAVNGDELDDVLQSQIYNRLRDLGISGRENVRDAMTDMGGRNRFHPVKEYFNGLPEWDGEDRLSQFVACLYSTDHELTTTYVTKWMIGAVAKIFEQGQNFMLILSGGQGLGKSYLVRWLCPLLFVEAPISTTDKDSKIRAVQSFLWEVAEIEGIFRVADMAALKGIITMETVTYRPHYGRYEVTRPAAASLAGTINPDGAGFLRDSTGSRRFAIVELKGIDHNYTDIDLDALWSQIYHMYKAGHEWALTQDEREKQEAMNKDYEVVSMVEQIFDKIYDIVPDDTSHTTTAEVVGWLELAGLKGSQRGNAMELAGVMRKRGVVREKRKNKNGYIGLVRKS